MNNLGKIKKIISPFSAVLISVGLIAVLYLIALAATSYQVNSGATATVNEWSICKNVTNANAKALFVPTNTAGEWSAFRTNKPGDVTLASCFQILGALDTTCDVICSASGYTCVSAGLDANATDGQSEWWAGDCDLPQYTTGATCSSVSDPGGCGTYTNCRCQLP